MSGGRQSLHFILIPPPPPPTHTHTYSAVFYSLAAINHLFIIFSQSVSYSWMLCWSHLHHFHSGNFFNLSRGNFVSCTWSNLHIYKMRLPTVQQLQLQGRHCGQGQWTDSPGPHRCIFLTFYLMLFLGILFMQTKYKLCTKKCNLIWIWLGLIWKNKRSK